WDFTNLTGGATNRIGHSTGMPSSVALPLVHDDAVLAALPAAAPSCSVAGVTVQSQSLRNQPCRPARAPRRPTDVAAPSAGSAVRVTWSPPASWAGGAQPTGYDVTLTPGGASVHVAADVTSAVLTGLTPGSVVAAVVTPVFAGGGGVPSDASEPVTVGAPSAG